MPPLAGAVQAGWQSTLQAAAVVVSQDQVVSAQSVDLFLEQSTLFAGISAQLLVFFKSLDVDHIPSHTGQNIILWLCYASLFFNTGATLTSLFLIDVVGELPFRSSHQTHLVDENLNVVIHDEHKLLKRYGARRSWGWLRRHCELPKITISRNFTELLSHSQGKYVSRWAYYPQHCRS